MARFEPTSAQRSAIEESGRAVLVSAAAGSGKTRVLTERLLRRIDSDADIDSFLVITFTKAAAAELKGRILDEISERLAVDPDNRRLRRQSALCAKAQIGTIDSFCQSFLREHCHAAQLSPEFRVIEEDRAEAIKQRVIQRVLDECYEAPDENFRLLSDTVGAGRDDKRLADTVLELHRKTQSHARPELWLRQQLEALEPAETDAGSTVWGAQMLEGMRDDALYWAQRMDEMCALAANDAVVAAKYGPGFAETALSLHNFARACSLGWDRARQAQPLQPPSAICLRRCTTCGIFSKSRGGFRRRKPAGGIIKRSGGTAGLSGVGMACRCLETGCFFGEKIQNGQAFDFGIRNAGAGRPADF